MIRFSDVEKEFGRLRPARRRVRALEGVSLRIEPGSAVAIVGPNGAGKTTLLQLLLGYLRPTRGSIEVDGLSPRRYVERQGVGYLPERVALPGHWTVRGALGAFAALAEVENASAAMGREIEACGLEPVADRPFRALSTGYRQRLGLAQALLAPRRVLVLDEPAHGLDPEWSVRLHQRVTTWREEDPSRCLVLVTHDMDEVDRLADEVVILREGRLVRRERLGRDATTGGVRVEVPSGHRAGFAEAFPEAEPQGDGAFLVADQDRTEFHRRLARYLGDGGHLVTMVPARRTAADIFREALLQPLGPA